MITFSKTECILIQFHDDKTDDMFYHPLCNYDDIDEMIKNETDITEDTDITLNFFRNISFTDDLSQVIDSGEIIEIQEDVYKVM